MKRHIARSRSLVLVVVLAVVAALCTVSTAKAASSASAAPHEPATSSKQCNFVKSLNSCESTDPTVAYYDSPSGNILNCTFLFDVTWGGGGSSTKTLTDPPAGHNLVGEHTYTEPGVYTITVTVTVTAGPCTATDSTHTFKLPLTKNVALAPAGKVHVKGHLVPLYKVTGKTHFRGKVAVALLTRACGLAIGKAVAVRQVGDLLFVTIAALPGADVVLILFDAAGGFDIFTHCVPIQVKKHVK
jgi:hypothetical protein